MQRDMSEREMEIKHFAHEHPLFFNESEEIPFCCNACGLRVLSSPSYICTVQGCSFYLHEPCTQLPYRLSHKLGYWDRHNIRLLAKPPIQDCSCSKCGNLCKNFTYQCDKCDAYNLEPLCAHPLDIRINHVSHKEHPMAAICKETLLLCDVCGRKHSGFFFSCHQCNYWIHQDCASLPSFLKIGRHRHPLSLVYSGAFASSFNHLIIEKCVVCEKSFSRLFGVYACLSCSGVAHVDCAVSEMENPGKIINLPPLDDALSSLTMHTRPEENHIRESNGEAMLEKYHAVHSLILNNETAHESVCNACIRYIAPPYYSCSQSACDFLLHKFCADLSLVVDNRYHSSMHLVFPRCNEFFSLFLCKLCLRLGNGFAYYKDDHIFHLECALAPMVIKHDSHKQHPLIQGGIDWLEDVVSCCGKINPFYYDIYGCSQCRFCIHIRCALLPKTVTHKFDKHPLTLVTDSSAQDLGDDHFCESCEEGIKPSHWFYRCIECDNSFHVDCMPSTGRYSRIKFGGTVILPPCHGDHPLTLVRMQGVASQTCAFCDEIIEGFKDGMALHCAECDFWIHVRCGWKFGVETVSEPYRDISDLSVEYSRWGILN